MSQRDLGDPRFDEIVVELREKAPPAPEGLRERVDATARSEGAPTVGRRWNLGLRRGLALAAACTVVVGVGAALVNGLVDSGGPGREEATAQQLRASPERAQAPSAEPFQGATAPTAPTRRTAALLYPRRAGSRTTTRACGSA